MTTRVFEPKPFIYWRLLSLFETLEPIVTIVIL
jgi:hypothetical protein